MDATGTAALVTGGASGLGEATARALHRAGAAVTIVDLDSQRDRADGVVESLDGERIAFAVADVTDEESVQAAVEQAAAAADGGLRIAVNCAGIGWAERTVSRTGPAKLGLFQKVIEVNLIGTFNVIRLAAAAMATNEARDGERGVIVNTASIAAFDGQIGQAAYSASKGGVVGLTLPVARDLASLGIRVCTIAPGLFDTPLLALLPEPARQALGEGIPNPKRLGDPAEYASLALEIVRNSYLNGEVIRLDGALRMQPK
jgi:NAD(P)-dependent dehydrogenase (short-subunit alcohol dehydrogenase family)